MDKIDAKKSLGQNFLNSDGALDAIIKAGRVVKGDTVLEIGPGKGALTKRLLEAGANVIAVEKDDRLIPVLEDLFANEIKAKKLKLIHGDILELDVSEAILSVVIPAKAGIQSENTDLGHEYFSAEKSLDPDSRRRAPSLNRIPYDSTPAFTRMTKEGANYKLIANIPYYITGEITRKFLSGNFQPSLIVVLVQKEVAERITTSIQGKSKIKEGKESILSISVKVYGDPKYIQTVKAGCFFPPPKVDSAILLIDNISKDRLCHSREGGNPGSRSMDPRIRKDDNLEQFEQKFFEVVKTGFAHKRKTLSSNLKGMVSKEKLAELGIDEKERAENLTLEQWLEITGGIRL
jgi:16S rRNA (adenine1518-N6/adenine1519-N6)-dimethyltransferase